MCWRKNVKLQYILEKTLRMNSWVVTLLFSHKHNLNPEIPEGVAEGLALIHIYKTYNRGGFVRQILKINDGYFTI